MTNINEALAKRKTHYQTNVNINDVWVFAPLCGQSLETLIYKTIELNYTVYLINVTCKRCIRSLTGRYNR